MADYVFSEAEKNILRAEGVLAGLEKITKMNPHAKHQLDRWRAGLLGHWGVPNIKEAEDEVQKISAALGRLKMTVLSIKRSDAVAGMDPRIQQYKNDLNALDGWTISLLETVISLVTLIEPQKGREKVAKLNTSLQAMMAARDKEGDPFDNKHLFAGYMG